MSDRLLVYEFTVDNNRHHERARRGLDDLKIIYRWTLRRMARLGMPPDLPYQFRYDVGEPSDFFIRNQVRLRMTVTLPPEI